MTTQPLTGKIALVTGGSRNVGRETALQLAERGADVVITYRERADEAAATRADLEAKGVRAASIQVDFAGTAGIPGFLVALDAQLGEWGAQTIDILVNNAGTLRIGTFDRVSEADLDAIYEVNYKAPFFLTQALDGRLADGGRIVNLGSGVAKAAFAPLVSYGPFKAALQSLTLYQAKHFGARGITVNAVAPGGLDDEFNAYLFDELIPGARDFIASQTALGRVGLPEDVSGVIAFLCEPQAGFISGQIVGIDGGHHL